MPRMSDPRRSRVVPLLTAVLVGLTLVLLGAQAARAETGPEQTVGALDAALINAMKAGQQAGYQGRYRILKPVVERTFDLPFIAQVVLGPDWGKLNAQQRARFVALFSELSVANYANNFNSYNNEHFKVVSAQAVRPNVSLVRTELVEPDGTTHEFDYLLHKDQGAWRIINVVADGVSNLSLQRSQYTSVLDSHGYAALIERLKQSIVKLAH